MSFHLKIAKEGENILARIMMDHCVGGCLRNVGYRDEA
jgi:hypothetical protein